MEYPDLLVLRHGETEWNRAGRLQGAADSPLTARGRAQAAAQGQLLAERDLAGWDVRSSPQARSLETARVALGTGADRIVEDARLAEITVGAWTGQSRAEIAAAHPHLFEASADMIWYDHAPGGEGLAALAARTRAFLDGLARPTVVFTHGITSRVLRCHALGLPWEAFADLPGGQGVIYWMHAGTQTCLGARDVTE